jgi:hypothetical protein
VYKLFLLKEDKVKLNCFHKLLRLAYKNKVKTAYNTGLFGLTYVSLSASMSFVRAYENSLSLFHV